MRDNSGSFSDFLWDFIFLLRLLLLLEFFSCHELSSIFLQSRCDSSGVFLWFRFNPGEFQLQAIFSVIVVICGIVAFSLDEYTNAAHIATIRSDPSEGANEGAHSCSKGRGSEPVRDHDETRVLEQVQLDDVDRPQQSIVEVCASTRTEGSKSISGLIQHWGLMQVIGELGNSVEGIEGCIVERSWGEPGIDIVQNILCCVPIGGNRVWGTRPQTSAHGS
jgi:hypothetical protein